MFVVRNIFRGESNLSKHNRRTEPQLAYENIVNINTYANKRPTLTPKSLKQEEYIAMLADPAKMIIFAVGPAGTGKTMLAVLAGIQALRDGQVKKLVITRPAVGVDDEKHGFLPGDITSKMEPWIKPVFDFVLDYYNHKDLAKMLEDEIIEISPLAYMRGRTFRNSWIILDEAQGTSVNQMKMALTRLGEGSKMVVTGDLQQLDRKFCSDNGLQDFIERLAASNSESISSIHFAKKDIQRHPVIVEILKMYGDI